MNFKDGIIWAGINSLYSSSDTGKTWHKSNFVGPTINEINFFDKSIGIIGASDGVYLTFDGGQTWMSILIGKPFVESVAFGSDPSTILASRPNGGITISTDMGSSWRTVDFGGVEPMSIITDRDGVLHVFSSAISGPGIYTGWINSSSDNGQSWSSDVGSVTGDDYTLASDSCDPNRLYLANENWVAPSDSFSRIFVSTNSGESWNASFTAHIGTVSGCISSAADAIYAGTWDGTGILRSLDRGQTWQSIGGPVIPWDSRDIVAVNDNIILCMSNGVWATYNSGGDSILSSTFVPPTALFNKDSIRCDSSAMHVLSFHTCSGILGIASWIINGYDSKNYTAVLDSIGDSLSVSFLPQGAGDHTATLIIALSDGSFDTIALHGFAIGHQGLLLLTADQKTDTLGATVAVPITINGLAHPEDVDLVLHYDGSVDYLGSFSPSGAKLDIPGDSSAGRSKLHIPGAAPGVIAGYAKFNAWNDSNSDAHATFDSLNVLTAISPCEYSLPEAATSTISAPSGCAIPLLSQLVHLGKEPVFKVVPNPSDGNVWVTSSLDLGTATIGVYDMLGTARSERMVTIQKDSPMECSLPSAAGMYTIVVTSPAGRQTMQVVREQ